MPAAERYLLDTSAVLTLTDQEDGSEKVEELLDRATGGEVEVEICAVSLMEVYYITLQEQGEDQSPVVRRRRDRRRREARRGGSGPQRSRIRGSRQ